KLQIWFEMLYSDEKYQHLITTNDKLSERALQVDGKILRPDAVFKTGKSFTVIDFKTGKREESHKKQVLDYLEAIAKVENLSGEGYVVYLPKMEWVRVGPQNDAMTQGSLF
ncbi:MAG: hypothetical protein AAGC47_09000, partial [Bacteroidota bacterium]